MNTCECCGKNNVKEEIKFLSKEELQEFLMSVDKRILSLNKIRINILEEMLIKA
jgi:hypothetical protein